MSGKAPKRARSAGGAGVVKPGDDPGPRQKYLENSEYFMGVALLTAQRSRDPSTQVGACIVNQENKIVGIGHNDMPNGCDGQLSWKGSPENSTDKGDQCTKSDDQRKKSDHQCEQSDDQWLETKYPYVCHAELNAIMNKNSADVKGCTMYVTLFPCNECTKLIIQAGIKEVIYVSDKHHDKKEFTASRRLLDTAEIMYKQFEPKIVFDFNSINGSKTHEDTAGPVAP